LTIAQEGLPLVETEVVCGALPEERFWVPLKESEELPEIKELTS